LLKAVEVEPTQQANVPQVKADGMANWLARRVGHTSNSKAILKAIIRDSTGLKHRTCISCRSAELEELRIVVFLREGVVMVLVLSALTSAAFGTGVIVGLAIGSSTVACLYACREAGRVGVEERPPRPRPEPREEKPRQPGRTKV